MHKFPKFLSRIILLLFCCALVLTGLREYLLWRLPMEQVKIPVQGKIDKLIIPPRPGIRGIVISGPVIEPLFFAIDLSKAGVRTLNWRQLMAVDPNADVKVKCTIDKHGQLSLHRRDLLMEGHTEAGMLIRQALLTWRYTPYKSGTIQFWFNLPSKGKKLIIDTQELYRRDRIPLQIPVYDGQIHLIDGIPAHEIQLGTLY